jgi:lysophospholipase L1-like esterase
MGAYPVPAGPFKRMVILGDSVSYGMCAREPLHEWGQVVAGWLRQFQDGGLEVLNRGLPAEVISPRAPGYEASCRPSLIERYRRHCIDLEPDLVIVAEGLNDMRSGMPVHEYMADLAEIVHAIGAATGALIVIVGIYHQVHGAGANDPVLLPAWTRWTPDVAVIYNQAARRVAESNGALFVDAQAVMSGADWTLNPDCCHPNDLGHVLIGNAIFQAIATHCPGIAAKTLSDIERYGVSTSNTGGCDVNDEIRAIWQEAAARFELTD